MEGWWKKEKEGYIEEWGKKRVEESWRRKYVEEREMGERDEMWRENNNSNNDNNSNNFVSSRREYRQEVKVIYELLKQNNISNLQ